MIVSVLYNCNLLHLVPEWRGQRSGKVSVKKRRDALQFSLPLFLQEKRSENKSTWLTMEHRSRGLNSWIRKELFSFSTGALVMLSEIWWYGVAQAELGASRCVASGLLVVRMQLVCLGWHPLCPVLPWALLSTEAQYLVSSKPTDSQDYCIFRPINYDSTGRFSGWIPNEMSL